jgi:hypothetical protein
MVLVGGVRLLFGEPDALWESLLKMVDVWYGLVASNVLFGIRLPVREPDARGVPAQDGGHGDQLVRPQAVTTGRHFRYIFIFQCFN